MFGNQFPNGLRATDVRFYGRDTWRRRRWRLADKAVHDPDAAQHRRGAGAVRGKLQNGRLREQSAVRATPRQVNTLQVRSLHFMQSVMPGEAIVHEDEVCVNQRMRGKIFANHRREKSSGLTAHRLDEIIIQPILRIKANVGIIPAQLSQVEPAIGEMADEAIKAVARDETLGLCSKRRRIAQFLVLRKPDQFCIGTRVCQKMR